MYNKNLWIWLGMNRMNIYKHKSKQTIWDVVFFFNLINKFYLDFFTEPKRLKGLQLFMVSFYVYGSLKLFVFYHTCLNYY